MYLHELRNSAPPIEASAQHGTYSLEGYDQIEESELLEFIEVVERAEKRLDQKKDINEVREDLECILEYDECFPEKLGDRMKGIVNSTEKLLEYPESSFEEGNGLYTADILAPASEYEHIRVDYNGNADELLNADIGAVMAFRAVAEDGVKHGKDKMDDPEEYRMNVEVRKKEGGRVEINIWDNGPGVGYSESEVFEEKKGDNTGIGMYLTKKLFEEQGGYIHLSEELSNIKKGAGFKVGLPSAHESLVYGSAPVRIQR